MPFVVVHNLPHFCFASVHNSPLQHVPGTRCNICNVYLVHVAEGEGSLAGVVGGLAVTIYDLGA